MSSTYVDPNYAGTILYPQIEGMLLIHERVDVFAPNGHEFNRSLQGRTDHGRLARLKELEDDLFALIAMKRVNPVVRERYVMEEWRTEVSQECASSGDDERAAFYAWRDWDRRLKAGPMTILADDAVKEARRAGEAIADSSPHTAEYLAVAFNRLKGMGQLPRKYGSLQYKARPVDTLHRELAGDIGADVEIMRTVGSTGTLLPQELGGLAALYDWFGVAMSGPNEPSTFDRVIAGVVQRLTGKTWELTRDDERLALEIAQRLSRGYRLVDVLDEYHNSGLATQCRLWILSTLREAREAGEPDLGRALVRAVDGEEIRTRGTGRTGDALAWLTAASPALLAPLAAGRRVTGPLLKEMVSRRAFGSAISSGFIGLATNRAGQAAERLLSPARWLSFITEKAPRRWTVD